MVNIWKLFRVAGMVTVQRLVTFWRAPVGGYTDADLR